MNYLHLPACLVETTHNYELSSYKTNLTGHVLNFLVKMKLSSISIEHLSDLLKNTSK